MSDEPARVFDAMWAELVGIGRHARTGGYRRFAWTDTDRELRAWFVASAEARGLDVTVDRCGNQWAWWGDPDSAAGVVTGSHLDSVPDGGAFDGPLGVVSAFAAIDALRSRGAQPARPIGVVNFCDEEGARFGVACVGSRLLTGALAPQRALALRDTDGVSLAEALAAAGQPTAVGPDLQVLRRIGQFVELHVEQGRGLVELDAPVGVASEIWPHGRWRMELPGEANHAGTTQLVDRQDPMLALAAVIVRAREAAALHGGLATVGKVQVEPNGVNAIPAHITAWLDARAPDEDVLRAIAAELAATTEATPERRGSMTQLSWTPATRFDPALRERLVQVLGGAPVLATGAGHDAGILAAHGIPSAMLFVRNPTGVSHSPAEFAERADCLAGVEALTAVLDSLSRVDR